MNRIIMLAACWCVCVSVMCLHNPRHVCVCAMPCMHSRRLIRAPSLQRFRARTRFACWRRRRRVSTRACVSRDGHSRVKLCEEHRGGGSGGHARAIPERESRARTHQFAIVCPQASSSGSGSNGSSNTWEKYRRVQTRVRTRVRERDRHTHTHTYTYDKI